MSEVGERIRAGRYTHVHIEAATHGYVNRGKLRSWRKYLKPTVRDNSAPGGPATYDFYEVFKIVLMARLRQGGVGLDSAAEWANDWITEALQLKKDTNAHWIDHIFPIPTREAFRKKYRMAVVISQHFDKPQSVTWKETDDSLSKMFERYGEDIHIINIFQLACFLHFILYQVAFADEIDEKRGGGAKAVRGLPGMGAAERVQKLGANR